MATTTSGFGAMTSARKIAANRANARRSTGPRTAAGRARSAPQRGAAWPLDAR